LRRNSVAEKQQQTDADVQLKDPAKDPQGGSDGDKRTSLDERDPGGSWYPETGETANKADETE
jgi:hypothetical protein